MDTLLGCLEIAYMQSEISITTHGLHTHPTPSRFLNKRGPTCSNSHQIRVPMFYSSFESFHTLIQEAFASNIVQICSKSLEMWIIWVRTKLIVCFVDKMKSLDTLHQ